MLVVLAAGAGHRFGGGKLLARFHGLPLVHYAASASNDVPLRQKLAVVPDVDGEIADIFRNHGFSLSVNPHPENGLSMSVRLGLDAVVKARGIYLQLADMPLIPPSIFFRLWRRFAAENLDAIRPRHKDAPGHPVLVNERCGDALRAVTGDRGGGILFQDSLYRTGYLDTDECGVVKDIDTSDDLVHLQQIDMCGGKAK